MQKIIRENLESGIIQITMADERWYIQTTGEHNEFVPSVTWICGFYPKGIQFYKWLAEHGWDESQAIKEAAGVRGTRVHLAAVDLLDGKTVPMDAKYPDGEGKEAELTLEEYECLLSLKNFFEAYSPKVLAREVAVIDDELKYAGTIDAVLEIAGEVWLIDFKTGQSVWTEYELQVSAYKHAYPGVPTLKKVGTKEVKVVRPIQRLGILQLGYRRNKNKFKLTEIQDKFALFMSARDIWENETQGEAPKKMEYPESLTLNTT